MYLALLHMRVNAERMRKASGTLRLFMRHLAFVVCAFSGSVALRAQSLNTTELPRAFRLIISIGDLGQPDENRMGGIGSVAVSLDGSIWVVNGFGGRPRECEIRVFDASGKWARSVKGFGEITKLTAEDSLVVVSDMGREQSSAIRPDGKVIRTHRLTSDSQFVQSVQLRDGLRVTIRRPRLFSTMTDSRIRPFTVVSEAGISRTHDDTLALIREDRAFSDMGGRGGTWFPTGFGAGGDVAFLGDSIVALVDGYRGLVRWLRATPAGTESIRTESVGSASRPVSSEDVAAAELRISRSAVGAGNGRTAADGRPAIRLSQTPPLWSAADRALFSPDGNLWIRTPSPARTDQVWRVIPPSGSSYAVSVPADFTIHAVRGSLVYGVFVQAGTGQRLVRVYEVVAP